MLKDNDKKGAKYHQISTTYLAKIHKLTQFIVLINRKENSSAVDSYVKNSCEWFVIFIFPKLENCYFVYLYYKEVTDDNYGICKCK